MKARRVVAVLVSVGAGASLMWATAPGAQAAPLARTAAAATAGKSNPAGTVKALYSAAGFQRFVDSVKDQVHAQYPSATLRIVAGSSPTGPTTSIQDVTNWQFDFNDTGSDGRPYLVLATVSLPDWTATITTLRNTVAYSRELTGPAAMSPFQAIVRLQVAGYTAPFTTVAYARPIGPHYPHPLFIVDQGDDYVAVDTVTREVAPFDYSVGPGA